MQNSVFSKNSYLRRKQQLAKQFAEETAAVKNLDDIAINENLEVKND